MKPIQVLPLVRSGAADAFGLSDAEIALGAASHSAEPRHVEAVDAWLDRIGLGRDALECGAGRPLSPAEADRRLLAGEQFESIHNCCSGKHAGFLTIAQHLGIDPAGYIEREHPVQQLVTAAIAEFTGIPVADHSSGTDGCGIPTFAMPLHALAGSLQRLVQSEQSSTRRVVAALTDNQFFLSGSDRLGTRLVSEASEPLLIKDGAEGVFVAALPTRGIGVAVKVRDGALRASEAAITAVLGELGVIDPSLAATEITNKAGTVVGLMEVCLS